MAGHQLELDGAGLADVKGIGQLDIDPEAAAAQSEKHIHAQRHQDQRAEVEGELPQRLVEDDQEKGERHPEGEEQDGAARGPDHRGAAVWSRISCRMRSVERPSISAPGESSSLWRRTGNAKALMSSGMTKSRPCSAAKARAAAASIFAARVEAPTSRDAFSRVARTTSTM